MTQLSRILHRAGVAGLCTLLAAAAGCGGDDGGKSALAEFNSNSMQRLANLYFAFQLDHDFKGPKDEAEFKKFIAGVPTVKLANVGVDPNAIDDLFVSPRDEQPYKIRYGVMGSAMGSAEPVIFEATGVDGKREVGFLNMTQREVDDAEYETLWSGKGQVAQPTRER